LNIDKLGQGIISVFHMHCQDANTILMVISGHNYMGLMIMKSMVAHSSSSSSSHQVIKEGIGNWNEWVADIYTRAPLI
jgi:hypothetical protein